MSLLDYFKSRRNDVAKVEDINLPLFQRIQGLSITVALFVILLIFALVIPDLRFLRPTNITNILFDSSEILILATSMTFVIIAGGIDLSVGSMLVFSSVICAITMAALSGTSEEIRAFQFPRANIGIPIGVTLGILAGTLLGVFNGILVVFLRINPFIVTLGTYGIYYGLSLVITNGRNTPYVPPGLQQVFGSARLGGVLPIPVIVAIIIVIIGFLILGYTRFGVYTFAIGANRDAPRLAGVNTNRHLVILYTLNGLCAGIAGVVDVARFNTTSIGYHATDNLQAISAVILGGTSLYGGAGGMIGTFIGSFLPSVLSNGFIQLGLQPYWQQVVLGFVLIIAVFQDTLRRRKFQQDI